MAKPAELLYQSRIAANTIKLLVKKTFGELRDYKQLSDPKRRRQLFQNGAELIRAAISIESVNLDIDDIARRMVESGIETRNLSDGCRFWSSRRYGLVLALFPPNTKTVYCNPFEERHQGQYKAVISGPTIEFQGAGLIEYPSEGYLDHRGVVVDFRQPHQGTEHHTGGIFVDNVRGDISILGFRQLEDRIQRERVSNGQAVMQANWFLDDTLDSADLNLCLKGRLNYNGLGTYSFIGDRQLVFAVTSGINSRQSIAAATQLHNIKPKEKGVRLETLMALTKHVGEEIGSNGWRLAGTEFTGGGIYINQEPWPCRPQFYLNY